MPRPQLVLKYSGLGDPIVKQRYLDLFAARGVAPQRLELLPPSSYAEYLATYRRVDVALDPFPFSGSVTTCEALWMGVPVVTCPGETFASRHSLSHLSNVGLTETTARDLDEYVELAVSLAGDLPRWPRCGPACGSGWPPRPFAMGSGLQTSGRRCCARYGRNGRAEEVSSDRSGTVSSYQISRRSNTKPGSTGSQATVFGSSNSSTS